MPKTRSSKRARAKTTNESTSGGRSRPRKAKGKKESQDNAQALSSVIPHLVQNGWIGASSLCSLLQVSPTVKCDDELWKLLCCEKWPNSVKLDESVVLSLGGYRSLFRHRMATMLPAKEPKAALPMPKLKKEKFGILLDVSVAGESACSEFIDGDYFSDDMQENGKTSYYAEEKYVLGNAHCWMSGSGGCSCKPRCRFDAMMDYRVCMHFIRTDTTKTSCIYDADIADWDDKVSFDMIGDPKDRLYDWRGDGAWATFHCTAEPSLQLRQTAIGAEIQRRLKKHFRFIFSLYVEVIAPGEKMGIVGYQIEAALVDDENDYQGNFDAELEKKTGVTLLHVLDQLQCLDDMPDDET